MIFYQSLHRTLKYLSYSETGFFCRLLEYFFVAISNGADKTYRILCIIILHHISADESDKAVKHYCADDKIIQMLEEAVDIYELTDGNMLKSDWGMADGKPGR